MSRPWLLALVLSCGCAGPATTIRQDFIPGTDFSPYSTYAWIPNPPARAAAVDALIDRRFRYGVEAGLQDRGYAPSSPADPSFYVGYQLVLEETRDVQTVNEYWGSTWRTPGLYAGTTTTRTQNINYTTGTLIVDVFDAASHQLIWRGSAEGRLDEAASPEQREARAAEVARSITRQFPSRD